MIFCALNSALNEFLCAYVSKIFSVCACVVDGPSLSRTDVILRFQFFLNTCTIASQMLCHFPKSSRRCTDQVCFKSDTLFIVPLIRRPITETNMVCGENRQARDGSPRTQRRENSGSLNLASAWDRPRYGTRTKEGKPSTIPHSIIERECVRASASVGMS